jgi:uncharacterized protein
MKVSLNGKPAGAGKPGTYLSLNRQWASGDAIEFTLPAAIQVKRYAGADQVAGKTKYSVEYGPILLAAVGSPKVELSIPAGHEAQYLANYLEPIEGAPLHFTVRGNPGQKLMPYWQIADEEFTCYPVVITV